MWSWKIQFSGSAYESVFVNISYNIHDGTENISSWIVEGESQLDLT